MRAIESQPMATLGARGGPKTSEPESGWSEPGRYRAERSLGGGKLGEVFRGIDTALGRPVAIRRLTEAPGEAGKADRFLKEAAATARVSHPRNRTTHGTRADAYGEIICTALAEGERRCAQLT